MTYPTSTPTNSDSGDRPAIATSIRQFSRRRLIHIAQQVISYLTRNAEPRITHRLHADGTSTWRIYDPYSEQSVVCHSVAEVREWLEARYSYRFRC